MRANYHTHTWRCEHAQGREEDYIRTAIAEGFDILGFADHTPQFFPGDYYSTFRMRPHLLQNYCATVRALADRYRDQIAIPLGVEVEWYPDLMDRLLPVLRDHGIGYMLLGQHFIGNEMGQHYSGAPTEDPGILKQYCRQAMEGMNTGLFTYFAHPDLIKFQGDQRLYREQMRTLCREAKSCGMPLEMNMLGQWAQRNYPDRRFWQIAAEEGCTAIIGWDAHAPEHLRQPQAEKQLRQMAAELGITLTDTADLRPV